MRLPVLLAGLTTIALSTLPAPTLAQTSSPKPAIADELLWSNRGIDYRPLQELLRAGKWVEANNLTSQLVLQMANQTRQGYLIATDTRSLPCTDLRTLDRLWIYYSNYHYGFSVQAHLWDKIGGQTYDDSRWIESMFGWKQSQVIADIKQSPRGHLPLRPAYGTGIMDAFGGGWIVEMPLRMKACGIR